MKNKILKGMFGIFIILVVVFTGLIYLAKNESSTELKEVTAPKSEDSVEETVETYNPFVSENEIVDITNDVLTVLYEIYFTTQESNPTVDSSVSGIMMSLLTEAMLDKNRLDKLIPDVEKLAKHPNKAIATTGISLYVTTTQLSKNQDIFIKYIRSEDVAEPSLSEFQYQLAQFQTENKDAFFNMIEGTSLYPYVFIEFSEENESNKSRISEESRVNLISEIDSKFGSAFEEEDIWNEETGNRNAVLMIVRNYREFLVGLEGIETTAK